LFAHATTQDKIECWHQTPIDRILLENYNLPGDLGTQVEAFAAVYTHPTPPGS
jgi:hypothetical protein